MSAQSLFSSVFSCSPSSRTFKRRLRQTRSLDPALMRHYGTEEREAPEKGDFTWSSVSGRSVGLQPVPLQSLSELERVRLQDVAFSRLLQDYDLGCQIAVPKDGQKRKKSLRKKLDSLSKEKSKDKESMPQAFGIPLWQVISNDRAHKQRLDPEQEEQHTSDLTPSLLHFTSTSKRANKDFSSSNSSLSSASETPNASPAPSTPEVARRTCRRGGVSVDCITDLDDNQSRLLEALQLSLPVDTPKGRKKHPDKKLSLNPIYRQVPRVVDCCCQHLEKYGLQTVGIFRIGSSKKRLRQLREEFDQGTEVQLDEDHSVHDVAALLKEFLRDMPDALLSRELYTAFINSMSLDCLDQVSAIQLLIYLLPPCNTDTLQRLLHFLSTVAAHAEDGLDGEGFEATGNKMTSLNLATIFGPNLLHKQKNSDKEFTVQSFARAEESTAIISVVQRMINTCETLFMVPPDLQNEVLMSVQETDADVVDYLLRRKASQYSGPGPLRTGPSFSRTDRRLSSDSNKASSGEVSPYDNNSPVMSNRMWQCKGDGGPLSERLFRFSGQYKVSENSAARPGDTCPTPPTGEEALDEHFWGAWHRMLSKELMDRCFTDSHGDVSESESYEWPEALSCHQGESELPVTQAQTSLGVSEPRPHPLLTRASSGPNDRRGQRQAQSRLHHRAVSSEDLAGRTERPVGMSLKGETHGRRCPLPHPGPLQVDHISHSAPSLPTQQPGGLGLRVPHEPSESSRHSPQLECPVTVLGPAEGKALGSHEWPRERWNIWQLLSTDNADTLPETLV